MLTPSVVITVLGAVLAGILIVGLLGASSLLFTVIGLSLMVVGGIRLLTKNAPVPIAVGLMAAGLVVTFIGQTTSLTVADALSFTGLGG